AAKVTAASASTPASGSSNARPASCTPMPLGVIGRTLATRAIEIAASAATTSGSRVTDVSSTNPANTASPWNASPSAEPVMNARQNVLVSAAPGANDPSSALFFRNRTNAHVAATTNSAAAGI